MDLFLILAGGVVTASAAAAFGVDAARGAGRELARLTLGLDDG